MFEYDETHGMECLSGHELLESEYLKLKSKIVKIHDKIITREWTAKDELDLRQIKTYKGVAEYLRYELEFIKDLSSESKRIKDDEEMFKKERKENEK